MGRINVELIMWFSNLIAASNTLWCPWIFLAPSHFTCQGGAKIKQAVNLEAVEYPGIYQGDSTEQFGCRKGC